MVIQLLYKIIIYLVGSSLQRIGISFVINKLSVMQNRTIYKESMYLCFCAMINEIFSGFDVHSNVCCISSEISNGVQFIICISNVYLRMCNKNVNVLHADEWIAIQNLCVPITAGGRANGRTGERAGK